MTARGIRNNNPGNIKRVPGVRWQGESPVQTDDTFVQFQTPAYGIRAIARVLITYQDKREAADGSKIDTVQEIIERWAPSSENHTSNYVGFVRTAMGLEAGGKVDVYNFSTMKRLVEAIIAFENGSVPYSDAQITKGIVLAGIEPPMENIQKSRTVRGSQIAIVGTIMSAVSAQLSDLQSMTSWLKGFNPELAIYVASGVTILGILAVLWARIDDKRKGLR